MKKYYEKMSMVVVTSAIERPILATSIINDSLIKSVGQELGPTYDISVETDNYTDKTFSHEWNQGN